MPEEMTILKIVEAEETTFVKTVKPTEPVVNKELIGKMLHKLYVRPDTASDEPRRMIRIRCDRNAEMWALYDAKGQKPKEHFTCGVIKDASLSSKELPAYGCGGADYIGMASGDMISENQPVTVPTKHVHRLVFDRDSGDFLDAVTRETITKVDYLILKEGCHAEYISA